MLASNAGATDGSYANIDQFRVTHVDLNLDIDFDAHLLRGSATLTVRRLDPGATQLILDSRDLNVTGVDELTSDFLGSTKKLAPIWVSRPFHSGRSDPARGSPLIIDLPRSTAATERIRVEYETSPRAAALHWGTSAGSFWHGARPFFYSLSEPIGARSWIPLQDTPRVRMTWRAHIHTPADLVAVMSGARDVSAKAGAAPQAKRSADHLFVSTRPIPSYLLDLLAGDLKFQALGPHSGVYAERAIAAKAAKQFAAAEALRGAGERLLGVPAGPRRDIVVMPASFALAFAESAQLTFVSPTLIAPGKALLPAAVRELPYADAAERVGIDAWQDRWIGQAFAGYLKSRIIAAVYGAPAAAIAGTLDWQSLNDALAVSTTAEQVLAADPEAPDAGAAADIPYEKGALFLKFLDASFGRSRFDAFLHAYYGQFAGHSITTAEFVDFLTRNLLQRYPGIVTPRQVEAWIFEPGLPANAALPQAAPLREVDLARSAWLAGRIAAPALGARDWPAEDWIYFLRSLPPRVGAARLAELDAGYALTRARNAEIEGIWLRLALQNDYQAAFARLREYLPRTGRIDLLGPLYRQSMQSAAGAALAKQVYSAARPGYDPAAAKYFGAIVKP